MTYTKHIGRWFLVFWAQREPHRSAPRLVRHPRAGFALNLRYLGLVGFRKY